MRNSSSKLFFKNAFIIAAGGFIAKILGALYRIPLTNLLGGTGMGLYQMVFPVYCILLDFAGAGLPCGLSKLISANVGEDAETKNVKTFKTAFLLMSAIGGVGSLAMFFAAKPLAIAQGNGEAYLAYTALSPAVFFVALISCYRGYFQGRQMMMPTALSQIIEQLVKLGAGLGAVKLLLPSAPRAAAGAAFAVTLSEVAAFIMLAVMYRKFKTGSKLSKEDFSREAKGIFKICLPVTLVSVLLPLSQVADSFLIINILGRSGENATSLYGLFSGGVMSVIGVPFRYATA